MGVYKELFYERDDSMSGDRHYDLRLAMDNFRPGVEDELRQDVDLMLRHELVSLRLAVDNAEDKPAKKGKKKKAKKKKRKKKVKDPVANRSSEFLPTNSLSSDALVRLEPSSLSSRN